MDSAVIEAFESRVERVTETGCWLWVGTSGNQRYGTFRLDGRYILAHRAAWLLFVGPIPDGMEVCHRCDVGFCANPSHLFIGTHKENCDDRDRKGRAIILRGERCGQSKLTEDEVRIIRASRENMDELAELYGVGRSTIEKIRYRTTWRHIS